MAEMEKMIEAQQKLNEKKTAARKADEAEVAKALTFYIDDRIYGAEISYVSEILGVPHITLVPGVPPYIKGVINVRSKVVPIVDVRVRFGLPEREYDEKTCTVIIVFKGIQVGLIVDQVRGVIPVIKSSKKEIPALEKVNNNKFIQYILESEDEIKMVLDLKKLLFEEGFDDQEEEEE